MGLAGMRCLPPNPPPPPSSGGWGSVGWGYLVSSTHSSNGKGASGVHTSQRIKSSQADSKNTYKVFLFRAQGRNRSLAVCVCVRVRVHVCVCAIFFLAAATRKPK